MEVFEYRSGFYRGMAVSLILLAASLLAHAAMGIGMLCYGDAVRLFLPGPTYTLAALAAIGAAGSRQRYMRFDRLHVEDIIFGFLVVTGSEGGSPSARSSSVLPTYPSP
jgi:hypothetical protein